MGNGKKGKAPCGHEGEHVFANYVQCDLGCDAKRDPNRCPWCFSSASEPFSTYLGEGRHCMPCGRVWQYRNNSSDSSVEFEHDD